MMKVNTKNTHSLFEKCFPKNTFDSTSDKFSEKQTFLTPWYAHVRKKCSFLGKFGVLCFLETSVLTFALLPYCQRILKK